jgi:phosphatidylinositol glycan class B
LRSSLHPELFAGVYLVAASLARFAGWALPSQAELLVAAPKVTQAVFAALLDCYTWKLAERVYGRESRTAFAAVGRPCVPFLFLFLSLRPRQKSLIIDAASL